MAVEDKPKYYANRLGIVDAPLKYLIVDTLDRNGLAKIRQRFEYTSSGFTLEPQLLDAAIDRSFPDHSFDATKDTISQLPEGVRADFSDLQQAILSILGAEFIKLNGRVPLADFLIPGQHLIDGIRRFSRDNNFVTASQKYVRMADEIEFVLADETRLSRRINGRYAVVETFDYLTSMPFKKARFPRGNLLKNAFSSNRSRLVLAEGIQEATGLNVNRIHVPLRPPNHQLVIAHSESIGNPSSNNYGDLAPLGMGIPSAYRLTYFVLGAMVSKQKGRNIAGLFTPTPS